MSPSEQGVSALALAEPLPREAEARGVDHGAVERATRDLIRGLGADLDAQALEKTPRRVAEAYPELIVARSQERLTTQVADWLERELEPKGVGVVLEAEHMCMSLRGVQKLGAKTITSAMRGLLREDPRTRQEFLSLTSRTPYDQ